MALKNLPLHSPPTFPQQPFLTDSFVERCIKVTERALVAAEMIGTCCYETPESSWGAADAELCQDPATVHDVVDGLEYCPKHFRQVRLTKVLAELGGAQ